VACHQTTQPEGLQGLCPLTYNPGTP